MLTANCAKRVASWSLSLLALSSACGGNGTDPDAGGQPQPPGLRVIAGEGVSDTIETVLAAELAVEVIGANGRPASGISVTFLPLLAKGAIGELPSAFVGRFGTPDQAHVTDTTDGRGLASTRVRLGPYAVEAKIVIRSALGSDTASYTVRPGMPTYFDALPADTALYLGAGFAYRSYAFDRRGNVRTDDSLSSRIQAGPLASNGSGRVSGTAFGRGMVLVRLREFEDTVFVSVVPRATLVAITATLMSDDSAHVVTLEADGSAYRVLSRIELGGAPYWSPTRSRVVFQYRVAGGGLHTVDLDGTAQRLIPAGAVPPVQLWPQYSRDGAWVHFAAGNDLFHELWRVRSDGTSAQRIGPPVPSDAIDTQPSPSPDGRRVAFVSTRRPRSGDSYPSLWILDVESGAITDLRVGAIGPRWSPDGQLIAFTDPVDHFVKVIRPDGTGARTVNDTAFLFLAGLDWSPDSKWIAATMYDNLAMIEVSSSLTIPIPLPVALWQPSWRH